MSRVEISEQPIIEEDVIKNISVFYVLSDNYLEHCFCNNIIRLRLHSNYFEIKQNLSHDFVKIMVCLLQSTKVVIDRQLIDSVKNIDTEIGTHLEFLFRYVLAIDPHSKRNWVKIPSYDEIQDSVKIYPQEISYNTLPFTQILDFISLGQKVAISVDNFYSPNTLIEITDDNLNYSVICRVVDCYKCEIITSSDWSILEMCSSEKFDNDKYQIQFQFVCKILPSGELIFPKKFNINKMNNSLKSKTREPIKESAVTNEQIYELLKEINLKLDRLVGF